MPSIKFRNKVYDLEEPIFGARAIAAIRGTSERETRFAVEKKRFTFRKDGGTIVSTPREILMPLIGEAGIERITIREDAA
jgi:hypothetical protein